MNGQHHLGPEQRHRCLSSPGDHEEQDGQRWRRQRWRHHGSPSPPSEFRQPRRAPKIVELAEDAHLPTALAVDGYRLGATVGYGSYSKVRLAMNTAASDHAGARVACKVNLRGCRRRRAGADLYSCARNTAV